MAIRKTKNKDYIVEVSLGFDVKTQSRKRVVRKGIKTLQEAKSLEREIYNLNEEGIYYNDNSKALDVINDYLKYSKQYDKPSSYAKKCNVFDNHITNFFENVKIRDITKYDILDFKELLSCKSISNNYKRYVFTALKTFFNYCLNHEIIVKNPAVAIDNFKKEKVIMQFWTINEFKQFISCVDDIKYKCLFNLLYFTGIRRGEALALTWNDIDLDNNKLHITKTCSHVHKQGYVTTRPKTEDSIRVIQINNKLVELLNDLKQSFNYLDTDSIFVTNNKLFSKTTIDRRFGEYVKESQVKKIRIHDFRHSHVALLIHLEQDVLSIAKRLGHSDVGITLNNYGHLYDSADKRIADKLETICI